eukprot:3803081-Karenia_brevis.AAC.1
MSDIEFSMDVAVQMDNCLRCDGLHKTDECPYYRRERGQTPNITKQLNIESAIAKIEQQQSADKRITKSKNKRK